MSVASAPESVGLFEYDARTHEWTWSQGLRQLHGFGPGEDVTTARWLKSMLLHDRSAMRHRLDEQLARPGLYTWTYQLRDGDGRLRQVRYVAQSEASGSVVERVHGFVIDVTDLLHDAAADAVAGVVEHRAVIEQAKGALMLSFGIDGDAAFDLLRGYSSRSNTKLAAVAEQIANGLSDPHYSREDPVRGLLDILLDLEHGRAGAAILLHRD